MTDAAAKFPGFSIIVPTYQRRELVCDCLQAIAALEYPGEVEVIVAIDGSTDGTHAAIEALQLPFPLRILEQDNGGLAAARNSGASIATGEILLFLDDDMACRPDLLIQHAESYRGGADAVVGEIPLAASSPANFLTAGIDRWAEESAKEARGRKALTPFNIFGGQISVKRALFEQLGGFDPAFTRGGGYGKEDADLGVRLLASHRVVHNPQAVSFHRYVVSPGEYLRRGYELGRADVRFANRHLAHSDALFERNGRSRWRTRLVLRPLAAVPGLRHVVAALARIIAAALLVTPARSNRALGWLFHGARQVQYWAGVRSAGGCPRRCGALMLCYHAIADHRDDPVLEDYSIPRAQFEAQLASLTRRGFAFISGDDLLEALRNDAPLPRRAVLLSFDDCYADLLPAAREVLQPRGIPALAFAVTGMASGTNEWDQAIGANRLRLLGWDELAGLHELGFEIGSHSRSHRQMCGLTAAELAEESSGSAADLAVSLGLRPRFFAYPFGELDARSRAAVEKAGYAAAFSLTEKRAGPACDPFNLPRMEVLRRDTPWRFWLKTTWPGVGKALRWRKLLARWKAQLLRT